MYNIKIVMTSILLLLNKIAGSVKLESADPIWQSLLSCGSFASADGISWVKFLDNLIQNNPRTANFLTLLELITSSVLNSVTHRGTAEGNVLTGNVGILHLCLIVITHFMSVLNTKQLKVQLFLPQEWPSQRYDNEMNASNVGNSTVMGVSGRVIVEALITTLCSAVACSISSAPIVLQGKIYMVKLFCVDILVSLCSSPHFQPDNSDMEKTSIFLRYIFLRGKNDNSDTMNVATVKRGSSLQSLSAASSSFAQPPSSSSSSTVPSPFAVSLVRALLSHAVVDNSLSSLTSATAAVSPSSPEAFVESFYSTYGDRREFGSSDTAEGAVNSLIRGIFAFFSLRLFNNSTSASTEPSSSASITAGSGGLTSRSYCENPLAARCLSLLLLLLHSNRSGGSSNCFRKVFFLLHDDSIDDTVNDSNEGQGDLEMMISRDRGAFVDRIHFDFRDLISGLSRTLPKESGVLLLYTFLQSHPTFVDTLASTGGTQLVLCPCLQELYALTCPKNGVCDAISNRLTVNHLYVMSICVLLIVQDRALLPALCTAKNFPISWYKERNLYKASLLDLCILCTVRTGLHAVFKLHDAYLLSNCAAVLNNIAASSAFAGGLHPHTCDRLVRISLQLSRRVTKGNEDVDSGGAVDSLVGDLLTVILKFIHSILRPRLLLVNVHLLYTLIHDYESLVQLFLHPSVVGLFSGDDEEVPSNDLLLAEQRILNRKASSENCIDNQDEENSGHHHHQRHQHQGVVFSLPHGLVLLAKHYLDVLDVLSVDNFLFSASQAINLLKSTIAAQAGGVAVFEHCFRGCALHVSDAESSNYCSYSYQEVDCPEEFFVPYIWDFTLLQSPEISFAKFKMDTT